VIQLRTVFASLFMLDRLSTSAKLRRSAEGATYIRQGGHHVGYRPTL